MKLWKWRNACIFGDRIQHDLDVNEILALVKDTEVAQAGNLAEGRFSGQPQSRVGHAENSSLADSRRLDIGGGSAVPTSLAGAPSKVAPFDLMVSEVGATTGEWILVSAGLKPALARIDGVDLGKLCSLGAKDGPPLVGTSTRSVLTSVGARLLLAWCSARARQRGGRPPANGRFVRLRRGRGEDRRNRWGSLDMVSVGLLDLPRVEGPRARAPALTERRKTKKTKRNAKKGLPFVVAL
ncbi:unnamed protein product [Dovyalis caffra]|uniref:Uncharacterized protein n=1 Tax=Dovyalis caffra TaxID=77055 RepID=A0AAV1R7E2_9ROSI|nr:unnamed protein product [Dovyalis caffra]